MKDPDGGSTVKHGRLGRRKTYKFKQRPYKHQVEAIQKALKRLKEVGGAALLMEPRTGKTKTAIDIASIMHEAGHVSRVLIMCPLGVMDVWYDEIVANCPEDYRITMWDRKARKTTSLPPWGQPKLDFVIMNPDALSTPGKLVRKEVELPDGTTATVNIRRRRGGRFETEKIIKKWSPQMVIADESHRFKKPTAVKTRALHRMPEWVPYRLILTGTVQTGKKRSIDVYSQILFENPESLLVKNMTATQFKRKYSVQTTRNGYPQWLRPRNEKRMIRLLHEEAYSCTRREAFGPDVRLPNQIVHVELTGHNRELYAEMAEEMIAQIKTGEITEASIRLVLNLRLSQLTSGLAKTTPTSAYPKSRLLRVGRDKLNTLESLCEDWFEADEHVIVPCRFQGDIQGVRAMGEKLKVPIFEIHGKVDPRTRTDQWKGFNKQQGPALFIGQPQAMSLGIDLRSAAIMVWFSLASSWVDFDQTEQRNALNPDPRSYVYLLARGTYDEVRYQSLREDEDVARYVMRNPEKLWIP